MKTLNVCGTGRRYSLSWNTEASYSVSEIIGGEVVVTASEYLNDYAALLRALESMEKCRDNMKKVIIDNDLIG